MATPPRHPVWSYFVVQNRLGQNGKPQDWSVCQVQGCTHGPQGQGPYELKGKYPTPLMNHLNSKHSNSIGEELSAKMARWVPPNRRKEETQAGALDRFTVGANRELGAGPAKKAKINKYDKKSPQCMRINASVANFFSTGVPFRMVENPDFRAMIAALDSQYPLPKCHKTVSSWVEKKHEDMKEKIKSMLYEKQITVMSDIWSMPNLTRSFLGVTVSFYCQPLKQVVAVLLAIRQLNHPHNAGAIQRLMDEILAEYSIDKETQVFRWMSDNASNMLASFRQKVILHSFADVNPDFDNVETAGAGYTDYGDPNLEEESPDEVTPSAEAANIDQDLRQTFDKLITCVAHSITLAVSTGVQQDAQFNAIEENVLALINKFRHSGAATEDLRRLCGLILKE